MKKIVVSSLVSLFVLSCSIPVTDNLTNNPSSSLIGRMQYAPKGNYSLNFAELEKEYKSFNTKALSNAYARRMFTKFLAPGTANPTQVIRQLEFARYLKDLKSDSSYFDSLNTIISDDPTIYDKINNTSGVLDKKNGEANFRNFIDSLNPVQAPTVPAGFKLVAKGTFNMGTESGGSNNERPVHSVTFTKDLYMGEFEVTQGEWASAYDFSVIYDAAHSTNYHTLMGSKYPSAYSTVSDRDNHPVEQVSWWRVLAYCNVKSLEEGLNVAYDVATGSPTRGALLNGTGVGGVIGSVTTDTTQVTGYRLPTEAEWEFAARGGNSSLGYTYSGSNTLGDVAWYSVNSGGKSHVVGTAGTAGTRANELGLYDMSGNVYEWVQDYVSTSYSSASVQNPYISTGTYRGLRGGSWGNTSNDARSAQRTGDLPNTTGASNTIFGFRISRTVP